MANKSMPCHPTAGERALCEEIAKALGFQQAGTPAQTVQMVRNFVNLAKRLVK
jgi:hypothetical protein